MGGWRRAPHLRYVNQQLLGQAVWVMGLALAQHAGHLAVGHPVPGVAQQQAEQPGKVAVDVGAAGALPVAPPGSSY